MPRKTMQHLAAEYVVLWNMVIRGEKMTVNQQDDMWSLEQEMYRRVGHENAQPIIEEAKRTYNLLCP